MGISQLDSELSEMSSKLMMQEKELTKLKEDNKLLVKKINSIRSRRGETIPQVCFMNTAVVAYNLFYLHVTKGSADPGGVVRQW